MARGMSKVEQAPDFKKAFDILQKLYEPALAELSTNLGATLKSFLEDVQDVKVHLLPYEMKDIFRKCRIEVNDGTATDLQMKGDGVQSLAALALLKYVSEEGFAGPELVLAVEEPEAHLHPSAVRKIMGVLQSIASKQQVIVTTHSPLLVNRRAVAQNIIVESNRARPASSVKELRETLGVRPADNLLAAEVVLMVEGEEDKLALTTLLAKQSVALADALRDGFLAIDSLAGGSNLPYKLTQWRESLCVLHAFLDHDQAGKDAARKARDEALLLDTDIHYATSPASKEAELEDLYDASMYASSINARFGVPIMTPEFRKRRAKWSARMEQAFTAAGKTFDDPTERVVKRMVAEAITTAPEKALTDHGRQVLASLTAALEAKVAARAS